MSQVTLRINKELLLEVKQALIEEYNVSKDLSNTSIVRKVLSLFLYGTLDPSQGKELIKQRLQEVGASEEDYTKGRVRTWARERLYNEEEEVGEKNRFSPKLQEELKKVIIEEYEEENTMPRREVIREEPEEVIVEKVPESPPWKGVPMLEWEEIYKLYPLKKENPFIIYAKDDEGELNQLKVTAIKVVLAHLPPQDRTSQEAWSLIHNLYERFSEWNERRKIEEDEENI